MHKKNKYSVMIAVGAPKGSGLYEVWLETRSGTFIHCGYFPTRDAAESFIERKIESDCPSNSEMIEKPCLHLVSVDDYDANHCHECEMLAAAEYAREQERAKQERKDMGLPE